MCSLKTISYKKMPNVHVTRDFRDNNDINNEEILFCIKKKRVTVTIPVQVNIEASNLMQFKVNVSHHK